MARLDQSKASLRICGEDLNPDEISQILACEPTNAYRKGQIVVGKHSGKLQKRTGSWILNASSQQPENLDAQIQK
jgi:hypothetical protein